RARWRLGATPRRSDGFAQHARRQRRSRQQKSHVRSHGVSFECGRRRIVACTDDDSFPWRPPSGDSGPRAPGRSLAENRECRPCFLIFWEKREMVPDAANRQIVEAALGQPPPHAHGAEAAAVRLLLEPCEGVAVITFECELELPLARI